MCFHIKKKKHSQSEAFQAPFATCFRQIGSRKTQEDCCACLKAFDGKKTLALLADGMGGLAEGELVSAFVLEEMKKQVECCAAAADRALIDALWKTNEALNQMLGTDRIYQSGTTLVAVLADKASFHWLTVGDSRIYLLRNNSLICLNEEHTYLHSLLEDVLQGNLGAEAAFQNKDGAKLTSFLGMGELAHVDYSRREIITMPGDRILLCSDGVFGTVSEKELLKLLSLKGKEDRIAAKLQKAVEKKKKKNQDNFSAVLLDFSSGD